MRDETIKKAPSYFREFFYNDWRHMNWKLSAILVLLSGILIAVVSKFITG